VDLTVADSAR